RNLLELLPVLQLRGIEDCGAEPELIPKAQGGKAKELQGVRHGIERAISVEARPRLNPVHLLLEVKLLEKRSEMCIGEERDVVMAVPHHVSQFPGACQPTHMRGRLEQSYVL